MQIGFDNWLTDYAYHKKKVSVVDVTASVPMLHLSGSAGNLEGHTTDQFANEYNRIVADRSVLRDHDGHHCHLPLVARHDSLSG